MKNRIVTAVLFISLIATTGALANSPTNWEEKKAQRTERYDKDRTVRQNNRKAGKRKKAANDLPEHRQDYETWQRNRQSRHNNTVSTEEGRQRLEQSRERIEESKERIEHNQQRLEQAHPESKR